MSALQEEMQPELDVISKRKSLGQDEALHSQKLAEQTPGSWPEFPVALPGRSDPPPQVLQ